MKRLIMRHLTSTALLLSQIKSGKLLGNLETFYLKYFLEETGFQKLSYLPRTIPMQTMFL